MGRNAVRALCILAVCFLTVSCQKRETLEFPIVSGPLPLTTAKFTDAIPDDYGNLISVTESTRTPGWMSLWFQRPDKSVVVVFVNVPQGKIYDKVLTIPRK